LDLGNRGIPINSPQPISIDLANTLWKAAEKAGILIDGDPGYQHTKTLWGKVGKARLCTGPAES
jgi:hypothetical protein